MIKVLMIIEWGEKHLFMLYQIYIQDLIFKYISRLWRRKIKKFLFLILSIKIENLVN